VTPVAGRLKMRWKVRTAFAVAGEVIGEDVESYPSEVVQQIWEGLRKWENFTKNSVFKSHCPMYNRI